MKKISNWEQIHYQGSANVEYGNVFKYTFFNTILTLYMQFLTAVLTLWGYRDFCANISGYIWDFVTNRWPYFTSEFSLVGYFRPKYRFTVVQFLVMTTSWHGNGFRINDQSKSRQLKVDFFVVVVVFNKLLNK